MSTWRILGLLGSTNCLVILAVLIDRLGVDDDPLTWWIYTSLAFVGFHFVPIKKPEEKSVIGFFIDSLKADFKKEIDKGK